MRAIDGLERDGVAISRAVIAEMYKNPFWNARFGERGRRFADEDAGRHIEHLLSALHTQSPAGFVGYARWLRPVLTTRGMCTRHIEENFELLAEQFESRRWSEAALVTRQGKLALAYTSGPEGEIYGARAAFVDRVVTGLDPQWVTPRCHDDVDYHAMYLADAIANNAPRAFADYVDFLGPFLARFGVSGEHLDRTLQSLEQAVSMFTPETQAAARRILVR